jgi:hypothetical protein
MSRLLKIILSTLLIFGLSSLLGAANWIYQFAALCFVYPFTAWVMGLLKLDYNMHLLIWPFPIVYGSLIAYDFIFHEQFLNLMTLTIPFAPLVSFVLWKKTKSWNMIKRIFLYPVFFLIFFIVQDSYLIFVEFAKSQKKYINGDVLKEGDKVYVWSTSCVYCIKNMPILRKYVDNGEITAVCLAKNAVDSANAAHIAASRNFRSAIEINKNLEGQIDGFPSWVLSKGSKKVMVNIMPSYLFGFSYSLKLWDVIFD